MNILRQTRHAIVWALALISISCGNLTTAPSARPEIIDRSTSTYAVPTIAFEAPRNNQELADASYEAKLSFTNFSASATWALYASTTLGASSGGTEIISSQSISSLQASWTTTNVAEGVYSLYAIVSESGKTTVATSEGSVQVLHSGKDLSLTYYQDTQTLLQASCGACHKIPATNGAPTGFDLTSFADVTAVNGVGSMLVRTRARIADGTMPPAASDLSATNKKTILAWLDAGGAEGIAPSAPTTPAITLLSPLGSMERASSTIAIQAGFAAAATDAKWEVYYTLVQGSQTGGTLIAGNLALTPTQVIWDVSNLPAGTYFIYGILKSGGQDYKASATGSISVSHPVTQSFVRPLANGEAADSSFTVELAMSNAAASATRKLYYTQVFGAVTGGTQIGGTLPLTTSQVIWNTSLLTPGTYYLYTQVTKLGTTSSLASTGGVSVSHPPAPNNAPVVAVTSPDGAVTLSASTTAAIHFTSSDADGDALTFTIELSSNGGTSWTSLATGVTSSPYAWVIPSGQTQGIAYRLRVTADDGRGSSVSDTSNSNFGIANESLTFTSPIQAIMQASCTSCHTGLNVYSSGGSGTYDKRLTILSRVSNDSMPPGTPKLTTLQKERIQLWIWANAPQ
ncbi:MAG: hypothetical protein H7318_12060 [Oligoflexus sp.]|nr:hypothetical protein [Oligoflexus sp.]